ncbi:nuclear transport factor 2 family protein [Pseudactinotalea suaedae]|uniref:nuclear transport factor 2 family protein n=1 Tax=Pseudactinotalea suaedae TaxID=1524924 RepID=UPI0012E1F44E|nr:nuclear transport factor 2 family protein [Pseudactinotalea suaedae]
MTDDVTAVLADPYLDEVAGTIRSLYRALGDRPAFDAHLHPEITIWESDAPALLSLAELDALRDQRAAAGSRGPAPAWVRPEQIRVDRWEDSAVVRFVLRAHVDGGEDETFRVTDVLRRDEAGWRIVHHHAERRSG